MDYLSVLYYGIIQGLTEFLPVSSSGHLALLPQFLNINDPGVVFDLAMHVGTACSIMIYFRKDLVRILTECLFLLKKDYIKTEQSFFTLNLLISTLVTFVFVMMTKKFAFAYGRSPNIIAFNLFFFGLLMLYFDKKGTLNKTKYMFQKVDYLKASLIGLCQAMAIFPGVSRSGATLTISRALGLSRDESTRFSFLLSLPIIIGGFVFKLPELMHGSENFNLSICLSGIFISFVVGLITIHFFLIFIRSMGLWIFSIYRVFLAIILVYYFN
jgi:undecaprenyl-diphosphatase